MTTNVETLELMKQIPQVKHPPLVDVARLREIAYLLRNLPKMEYPINSAGEMLAKYAAGAKHVRIAGQSFDPAYALRQMPAYYFPIASAENLVEKIGALLKQKRGAGRSPRVAEMASIRKQLPTGGYPIRSRKQLMGLAKPGQKYFYHGKQVELETMAERIPGAFFPIRSKQDFERKLARLLALRA